MNGARRESGQKIRLGNDPTSSLLQGSGNLEIRALSDCVLAAGVACHCPDRRPDTPAFEQIAKPAAIELGENERIQLASEASGALPKSGRG
jgi:hypothetical protein